MTGTKTVQGRRVEGGEGHGLRKDGTREVAIVPRGFFWVAPRRGKEACVMFFHVFSRILGGKLRNLGENCGTWGWWVGFVWCFGVDGGDKGRVGGWFFAKGR